MICENLNRDKKRGTAFPGITLLFLFFLVWLSFCSPVLCAEEVSGSISLTRSLAVTGSLSEENQKGEFVLEAIDNAPMPQGGNTLILNGSGKGSFGPIEYSSPGSYMYTLREAQKNIEGLTIDDTVYDIEVYVYYETDDSLNLTVFASTEKSGKKSDISFSDSYSVRDTDDGKDDDTGKEAVPETGDESMTLLWLMIMIIAFLVMMIILLYTYNQYKIEKQKKRE